MTKATHSRTKAHSEEPLDESLEHDQLGEPDMEDIAKGAAQNVAHVLADYIKSHPIQSLVGAAALGFVAGIMVKRNKS